MRKLRVRDFDVAGQWANCGAAAITSQLLNGMAVVAEMRSQIQIDVHGVAAPGRDLAFRSHRGKRLETDSTT